MPLRDDEDVTARHGEQVEERQRLRILVDDVGGSAAGDDLAEDAEIVGGLRGRHRWRIEAPEK
jgi:hypothetical protein